MLNLHAALVLVLGAQHSALIALFLGLLAHLRTVLSILTRPLG